jgi:glycosyltransferase involved in cell wall biosynthesis
LTGGDAAGVSVVIAVRDGERYLAETLDSILGQSAPPGEVIVVDDGSTDGTRAVLDPYVGRVRIVAQQPAGVAAALNRGIAASSGELLAFLDADDLWPPISLECRLTRLAAADRPEAVFGRIAQFVSPELRDAHGARRFRFDPAPVHAPMFQTMLIARAAFDRVGPLATDYVTGANIDWVSRARAVRVRTAEVDDVVALRRLHESNLGVIERERQTEDLVRVVRAHRRRARST